MPVPVSSRREVVRVKTMVSEVLSKKGNAVWSVAPDQTVYEALELMRAKDIGAVLVVEGDKPVGIFSERDYARRGILEDRASRDTKVSEIMTREVYCVSPHKTMEDCMALMTARRLRHLPVVEHDRLIGLVSIGDAVKTVIGDQEHTLHELEMYVDSVVKNRSSGKAN